MLPLDARKVRILQAVVQDYVDTSRPVASERLIEIYQLGCKSATVRNEMADLVDMGYLVQPHTSAGRIPTDLGYRYYVDQVMEPPRDLDAKEARKARADMQDTLKSEIDDILRHSCQVLTGLTSYVSVATDPITVTTELRRVYLTRASSRQVLMVALFSTGQVEHRMIETENAPEDALLVQLSNFINSVVADKPVEDIERLLRAAELPVSMQMLSTLSGPATAALAAVARSLSERRVYLEGASHLMRQPEFHDVQRLEAVLNALEERSALFKVLMRRTGPDRHMHVNIQIGTENPHERMRDCTLISHSYSIGDRPAGYIGVIGPTRMHYERAIAAVKFMSGSLSHLLTRMCIAN
jgi:heat-inducible transcriptional repressor